MTRAGLHDVLPGQLPQVVVGRAGQVILLSCAVDSLQRFLSCFDTQAHIYMLLLLLL